MNHFANYFERGQSAVSSRCANDWGWLREFSLRWKTANLG